MKINVHAGHNPKGKIACGASDLLDESTEDRKIAREVVRQLRKNGHTVYNCTCNKGTSQNDVLKRIVAMCNKHAVDVNISIHLNSGRADKNGDNKVGGTEVLIQNAGNQWKTKTARRICDNMEALGFTDRGVKTNTGLYFLNHTKAPAILIEVCFVDDRDDYLLYNKLGYRKIAKAIADAIR